MSFSLIATGLLGVYLTKCRGIGASSLSGRYLALLATDELAGLAQVGKSIGQ